MINFALQIRRLMARAGRLNVDFKNHFDGENAEIGIINSTSMYEYYVDLIK